MSITFFKLPVFGINAETADCVRLDFKIPADLTKNFNFLPGQYLTFKAILGGTEVRRSYSICSLPEDEVLSVAVKKIPGGVFSSFVNDELRVGDELEVMPPTGGFTLPVEVGDTSNYVFYAAGSGITPCLSMIRWVLSHRPEATVSLYYGNKHSDSIIFRETLEGLKNQYMGRFSLHHILSQEAQDSPLFCGRINEEKCRFFEQKLNRFPAQSQYFLCGPAAMVFEVKDCLTELGVDNRHLHFELFTTAGMAAPKAQQQEKEKTGAKIRMKLDGLEFEFDFTGSETNILDAALKNGADLPFACKGGVCSTCKAHCDEGEVDMAVNYALEPDEVAAGYVLTCQSSPKSKFVYINFDK